MSVLWIYVMGFVCLAGQWAVLHGKNVNAGHYAQAVQPTLFIPAMLIGIIDFYHFIPLSLTLTLPEGHKVSTKQNLLLHFLSHFSSDWDEIWCGDGAIQAECPETAFE